MQEECSEDALHANVVRVVVTFWGSVSTFEHDMKHHVIEILPRCGGSEHASEWHLP